MKQSLIHPVSIIAIRHTEQKPTGDIRVNHGVTLNLCVAEQVNPRHAPRDLKVHLRLSIFLPTAYEPRTDIVIIVYHDTNLPENTTFGGFWARGRKAQTEDERRTKEIIS